MEFAPLKDVSQVRQFVGSSNWVRRYLLPCYAAAVKILGEYMKPGAEFPKEGLGAAKPPTKGCKAVQCIKLLCKHAIQLSVLDEASAIDGSRPIGTSGRRLWHCVGIDKCPDDPRPQRVQSSDDGR